MEIENCSATFQLRPIGPPTTPRFTNEEYLSMANRAWCTEYRPQRFHAIIMRLRFDDNRRPIVNADGGGGGGNEQQQQRQRKRRTLAALIFQSTKVVLTGLPHPDAAVEWANRVLRHLPADMQLGVHGLRVTNVVGAYRHPHRVAIHRLFQQLRQHPLGRGDRVHYEPCIFPALRIKMSINGAGVVAPAVPGNNNNTTTTRASCLVYISGRTIVTGLRCPQQLDQFFNEKLLPLLQQFPQHPQCQSL